MVSRRWWGAALTAGGLGLAAACGDSGSAPVTPASLAVTAGDGQIAPPGAALPALLRVTVTGSDNSPYRGATVNWTVTSGVAAVAPAASLSDALGQATTSLTFGNQLGPVTVSAAVAGLTPVTFNVTAVDPCVTPTPYTFGAAVNGSLASTDCKLGGYYTDLLAVSFPSQQGLRIAMTSSTFDTYVELYTAGRQFLAFNDDSTPGNTNSFIPAIVAPGDYLLAPSSYDTAVTGAYAFAATARSQTISGCKLLWVTRGIAVGDSVNAGDCVDANGFYSDFVVLFADSGSVLTVAERSAAFDAYLQLYQVDSVVTPIAFNDDSAVSTSDAFLVDTLPVRGFYFIQAGTVQPGQSGPYTLDIGASATAGAQAAAALRLPLPGRTLAAAATRFFSGPRVAGRSPKLTPR